jgi:uncharacterized protein
MPVYFAPGVYVEEVPSAVKPIAGVGTSIAGFVGVAADVSGAWNPETRTGMPARPDDEPYVQAPALSRRPVNSWTEFTQAFGDLQEGNQYLAHAVYGFFNNGGSRCWVVRVASAARDFAKNLDLALQQFESVDEIAIVAVPLPPNTTAAVLNAAQASLIAHCEKMEDRVAILDSSRDIKGDNLVISEDDSGIWRPAANPKGYGAFYFPWIEVADPLGEAGARVAVPPSGHVAGIYARVDAQRGVHKAPANEVVRGALDLRYAISRGHQEGLNPKGVNAIRTLNGNVRVWGARTVGGDANLDLRYVSVRRLLLFLRESIDEGLQWVVFEPNDETLWARITRNVTAFLTTVWREGALLGTSASEAFYVKCDAETNPPEVRDRGEVVTEIGVAVVRPAEFIVFKIAQWQPPSP